MDVDDIEEENCCVLFGNAKLKLNCETLIRTSSWARVHPKHRENALLWLKRITPVVAEAVQIKCERDDFAADAACAAERLSALQSRALLNRIRQGICTVADASLFPKHCRECVNDSSKPLEDISDDDEHFWDAIPSFSTILSPTTISSEQRSITFSLAPSKTPIEGQHGSDPLCGNSWMQYPSSHHESTPLRETLGICGFLTQVAPAVGHAPYFVLQGSGGKAIDVVVADFAIDLYLEKAVIVTKGAIIKSESLHHSTGRGPKTHTYIELESCNVLVGDLGSSDQAATYSPGCNVEPNKRNNDEESRDAHPVSGQLNKRISEKSISNQNGCNQFKFGIMPNGAMQETSSLVSVTGILHSTSGIAAAQKKGASSSLSGHKAFFMVCVQCPATDISNLMLVGNSNQPTVADETDKNDSQRASLHTIVCNHRMIDFVPQLVPGVTVRITDLLQKRLPEGRRVFASCRTSRILIDQTILSHPIWQPLPTSISNISGRGVVHRSFGLGIFSMDGMRSLLFCCHRTAKHSGQGLREGCVVAGVNMRPVQLSNGLFLGVAFSGGSEIHVEKFSPFVSHWEPIRPSKHFLLPYLLHYTPATILAVSVILRIASAVTRVNFFGYQSQEKMLCRRLLEFCGIELTITNRDVIQDFLSSWDPSGTGESRLNIPIILPPHIVQSAMESIRTVLNTRGDTAARLNLHDCKEHPQLLASWTSLVTGGNANEEGNIVVSFLDFLISNSTSSCILGIFSNAKMGKQDPAGESLHSSPCSLLIGPNKIPIQFAKGASTMLTSGSVIAITEGEIVATSECCFLRVESFKCLDYIPVQTNSENQTQTAMVLYSVPSTPLSLRLVMSDGSLKTALVNECDNHDVPFEHGAAVKLLSKDWKSDWNVFSTYLRRIQPLGKTPLSDHLKQCFNRHLMEVFKPAAEIDIEDLAVDGQTICIQGTVLKQFRNTFHGGNQDCCYETLVIGTDSKEFKCNVKQCGIQSLAGFGIGCILGLANFKKKMYQGRLILVHTSASSVFVVEGPAASPVHSAFNCGTAGVGHSRLAGAGPVNIVMSNAISWPAISDCNQIGWLINSHCVRPSLVNAQITKIQDVDIGWKCGRCGEIAASGTAFAVDRKNFPMCPTMRTHIKTERVGGIAGFVASFHSVCIGDAGMVCHKCDRPTSALPFCMFEIVIDDGTGMMIASSSSLDHLYHLLGVSLGEFINLFANTIDIGTIRVQRGLNQAASNGIHPAFASASAVDDAGHLASVCFDASVHRRVTAIIHLDQASAEAPPRQREFYLFGGQRLCAQEALTARRCRVISLYVDNAELRAWELLRQAECDSSP